MKRTSSDRLTLPLHRIQSQFAPVAQWIELSRPKGTIWVRFLVGAPLFSITMSDRIIKINELIHSLMGELLEREVSFKQGTFATIVRVDTAPNLRATKVYISAFPEPETQYVLKTLEHERRNLEHALHGRLATRPLPKLIFELDTTNRGLDQIEKILKEIHSEE